jgi:hypothetical protein
MNPVVDVPSFRMNAMPQSLVEAIEKDREIRQRFGEVRPLIHTDWQGKKWVAVGEQLYSGNWRYFSDFLPFFIKLVLTPEWGQAEIAKPLAERHPIMQWCDGARHYRDSQPADEDGNMVFTADGCTMAYLLLAYDLFALRHHQSLQQVVVNRLKNIDQFQGARYELFVAATCIRAGFDIEYENEGDSNRKHSEFIATHRKSKTMISVEAKSRHRSGVLGRPGMPDESSERPKRIGRLLRDAIAKATDLPHVIFIDVNTPPSEGNPFEKLWFKDVMDEVDKSGTVTGSMCAPFNLVVFTNHPFHYVAPGVAAPKPETISTIPTKPCVPVADKSEIHSLFAAAVKFGTIPQRFEEAD